MKNSIIAASFALIAFACPALAESPTPWPRADLTSNASPTGETEALRLRALRSIRHSQIVEAGFCNAPMLPPEYAAFCWGALNNANQTGGPIGAGIN